MHASKIRETVFKWNVSEKANAKFIVLYRSFSAGLDLNLHRHMLSQKNVSITLSLAMFKGMSHNLEL